MSSSSLLLTLTLFVGPAGTSDDPTAPTVQSPAAPAPAPATTAAPMQPAQPAQPQYPQEQYPQPQYPQQQYPQQQYPQQQYGGYYGPQPAQPYQSEDGYWIYPTWNETVRNNPRLLHLHRRSKLTIPGGLLTGFGAAVLLIALPLTIDYGPPVSASGVTWAYVLPGLGVAAGIPLIIVGAKAKSELNEVRWVLTAKPNLSPTNAGFGLTARF